MSETLKIGFLNPYSGVYPNYSQHIMAGILMGMKLTAAQQQAEFIPVYTQMGDVKSTLEAARKLLFFDRVDILSGFISSYSLPELKVLVEGKNKMSFFFNMGENLPRTDFHSPEIFINSQSLWQSQYALGKWAQKQFGGTGVCIVPFYESGYDLFSAFKKGTESAGASELGINVIPQASDNSSRMDLSGFFAAVSSSRPSFVHAIFCGKMGNEFLKQWSAQNFSKVIPLVVIENMAYEDMLEDILSIDIDFYTVSSWLRTSEHPENAAFVRAFENGTGQRSNIFALAGYEAGLAIREVLPFIKKNDLAAARHFLNHKHINGPRAGRNFNLLNAERSSTLDLLSVKLTANKIHPTVLDQAEAVSYTYPEFDDIVQNEINGWQNPYMCV